MNNTVFFSGNKPLSSSGFIGEVAYDIKSNKLFLYTGIEWTPIESYEDDVPKTLEPFICKCCGATVHGNQCEFCGVEYVEVRKD